VSCQSVKSAFDLLQARCRGSEVDEQRVPRKHDAEARHKAEMERMRAVIAEITLTQR
jgi:hypothetical protein